MRRILVVSFIVGAVLASAVAPAQALTKERSEVPLNDHTVLTGFCPFPVTATDEGKVFQDVFLDEEGNVVMIHIYSPGLRSTLEANGKSLTFQNSGPVFITIDPEGVFTAEQRGQSISFDQGLITGDPFILHVSGRITTHAVFNEETGFVDFIDSTRIGVVTDVCALLAP